MSPAPGSATTSKDNSNFAVGIVRLGLPGVQRDGCGFEAVEVQHLRLWLQQLHGDRQQRRLMGASTRPEGGRDAFEGQVGVAQHVDCLRSDAGE